MLGRTRRRSCAFVMPDRSTCRANPMRDEQFCYFHHPDHKQDAADARRLGGNRRRREKTLEGAYDLHEDFRSVDGLLRFVESGAIDLLGLDSSVARSNAMFRGALVAAKLLEVGDLAQRIAILEAVLKYRSPEPSSPFDDDLPKIDLPSEPSPK